MTDLDKVKFRKQLDLLQSKKEAITRTSLSKPGKYIVNTMLNAIKEAIQTLETLRIPDTLEEERSRTLAIIKDAQELINREYVASPFNPNMIETISQEMIRQADKIRDAIRRFDSRGLTWVDR